MQVRVRLYATLRQRYAQLSQGQSLEVGVEEGTTLAGLLRRLDIPEGLAKLTFVNGAQQGPGYVLQPDDSVGVFPPIAGGQNTQCAKLAKDFSMHRRGAASGTARAFRQVAGPDGGYLSTPVHKFGNVLC